MIISGGENVYSTEVEQALQQLRGVQMCAAVGLPDDRWGERVVAAVLADPSAGLSSDDVIAHCRTLIAGYKVPKQIKFGQVLPMTPTGKVKKRELRDQFLKGN
jgi:acyl-CoA synthetase (AMP-forming)/AMP-acid ligase II